MDLKTIVTPAAVAALMFSAAPTQAFGQETERAAHARTRQEEGRARAREGTARPREGAPRPSEAAPRPSEAAPRPPAAAPRPRDDAARARQESPRDRENADRARERDDRSRARDDRGRDRDDRLRPRQDNGRRWDARRYAPPVIRVAPRHQRLYPYRQPRFIYPREYRPGFSLGIFFGRPYRYVYPMAPAYGYPVAVAPGGAYGGVTFGIAPTDAAIYVDGDYVGDAWEFGVGRQPLTLPAGPHRIEIEAPGYEPIMFDVNVLPGQVIPFQGNLPPGY